MKKKKEQLIRVEIINRSGRDINKIYTEMVAKLCLEGKIDLEKIENKNKNKVRR